eukprot:g7105.t1
MSSQFEQELEFVQCLANPQYLHFLAENQYLDNPEFVAYLHYLRYWAEPEYARFIKFPHCLWLLRLLAESQSFRAELKQKQFVRHVCDQQLFHWQSYLDNVYRISSTVAAHAASDGDAGQSQPKEELKSE